MRIDAVNTEESGEEITEDARGIREENNQDMVHEHKGKHAWEEDEEVLRSSLKSVFEFNRLDEKSMAERRRSIDTHAGRGKDNKCLIMSQPTFNKWMDKKPLRKLSNDVVERIKAYIRSNGGII